MIMGWLKNKIPVSIILSWSFSYRDTIDAYLSTTEDINFKSWLI